LHALQEKLLRRDLFEEFCQEFTREMNRLRMAARANLTAAEHELGRVRSEIGKLVQALKDGVPASVVKDDLIKLEARQADVQKQPDRINEPPPLLHPKMADLYRQKVTELAKALEHEESRIEASEALRGLLDVITLTPDGNELRIELQGNLAAMLRAAEAQNLGKRFAIDRGENSPLPDESQLVQIMVVAGAGFEPAQVSFNKRNDDAPCWSKTLIPFTFLAFSRCSTVLSSTP